MGEFDPTAVNVALLPPFIDEFEGFVVMDGVDEVTVPLTDMFLVVAPVEVQAIFADTGVVADNIRAYMVVVETTPDDGVKVTELPNPDPLVVDT